MEVCPTHSLFLIIFLTLFIPSSILITAKSLDYPSFVIPPVSWINTIDVVLLGPILVNGNFTCGFHYESNGFFFAISFTPELGDATPSPLIVWSSNRNNPVGPNAVLRFTTEGDLILEDGNGASVWSTNTTDYSVSGLSLTTQGNLVLLGKNNKVIWQSFDHPTDSLVPGQRLVPGKKLRSNISTSNSSEGLYSLEIKKYGELVAYMETDPLQPYYRSDAVAGNVTRTSYVDVKTIASELIPFEELSIIKLGSDGHLMGYLRRNLSLVDLLNISSCDYPLACGHYGFCSESGSCSCYGKNTSSHLIPINDTQLATGCSLNPHISCEFSHDQWMIELLNHSINYFTLDYNISNTDEKGCKQACMKNCSCKAVIIQNDYSTDYYTNSCSLASEVFSFSFTGGLHDGDKSFIKIQNFTVTKNLLVAPGNKGINGAVIMGSTFGAIFALLLLCSFGILLIKKYSRKLDEDYLDHISGLPTRFSYDDLKVITKNFNNKLGEGGFGSVFKGTLSSRDEVAVKHLDGFGPVNKSFITEVQTIGSIQHFNLVSLVGFCAENSQRLLVYEYMRNGSLDQWIFNKNKELSYSLSWQSRKNIILDIAKGLAYLHEDCNQKIIHLDIKPQNILLDENFNAKVSDFGLSKLMGRDQSQVVTTMRGTPGYMAPEWLSSVKTEKADVYSFGIVVLEIVCGRPNVDRSKSEEDKLLVSLFKRKAEEEQLADLVDQSSEDMQTNNVEVFQMMKVAACCLNIESRRRPSMSEVVKVLEGSIDNIDEWLGYDFSNLPGPEVAATVSLIQPSFLSGPS